MKLYNVRYQHKFGGSSELNIVASNMKNAFAKAETFLVGDLVEILEITFNVTIDGTAKNTSSV